MSNEKKWEHKIHCSLCCIVLDIHSSQLNESAPWSQCWGMMVNDDQSIFEESARDRKVRSLHDIMPDLRFMSPVNQDVSCLQAAIHSKKVLCYPCSVQASLKLCNYIWVLWLCWFIMTNTVKSHKKISQIIVLKEAGQISVSLMLFMNEKELTWWLVTHILKLKRTLRHFSETPLQTSKDLLPSLVRFVICESDSKECFTTFTALTDIFHGWLELLPGLADSLLFSTQWTPHQCRTVN